MRSTPGRWRQRIDKLHGGRRPGADPEMLIDEAVASAQDRHRLLVEQATKAIAHHRQADVLLARTRGEVERVAGSTRRALSMAWTATDTDDAGKALEYEKAAEAFACRLVSTEQQVETLEAFSRQSAMAADQARSAVEQSLRDLRQALAERQRLLSRLDQARLHEQIDRALSNLDAAPDPGIPTLQRAREEIEARYARALGISELRLASAQLQPGDVEHVAMVTAAHERLEQMRAELAPARGGDQAAEE